MKVELSSKRCVFTIDNTKNEADARKESFASTEY